MSLRIPRVSHDAHEELAALCKAGGDALRLNILRVLANDSFGVLELAQIFDIGQSGMSHHLKVLAQAGLVATRREGNAVFYRRALAANGEQGARLQTALLAEVDALSLSEEVQQRVLEVHKQRHSVSQDFFSRMADHFHEQQDLIAALPQYRDSVLALIDTRAHLPRNHALELGPGDGSFLPELATRFAQVTGVDNSPAMLEQAAQQCHTQGLHNVTLQQADALHDPLPHADCIVVNMVLHHLAAPAEAFKHWATYLTAHGCLVICELCRHQQTWTRQACGDLWQGFEHDELTRWAEAAGLTSAESLYIGLKNGFQIQVRLFVPVNA